jgi:hypothetical protein
MLILSQTAILSDSISQSVYERKKKAFPIRVARSYGMLFRM